MDGFGFLFGTAVLATVLAIFGVVGRIVDGVACEIRWTLAPTLVDGVRAWGDELLEAERSRAARTSPDEADGPGTTGGPEADAPADPRDHGFRVPVQAVSRRGRHLAGIVVAVAPA